MSTRYDYSRTPLRSVLRAYNDYHDKDHSPDTFVYPRPHYIGRTRSDTLAMVTTNETLPLRDYPGANNLKPGGHYLLLDALLARDRSDIARYTTSTRQKVIGNDQPGGSGYLNGPIDTGVDCGMVASILTMIAGVIYVITSPSIMHDMTSSVITVVTLATVVCTLPFLGAGIGHLMAYPVNGKHHRQAVRSYRVAVNETAAMLETEIEVIDTQGIGDTGQRLVKLHNVLVTLDARTHRHPEYAVHAAELDGIWHDYEKLTDAVLTFAETEDADTQTRENETVAHVVSTLLERCRQYESQLDQWQVTENNATSDTAAPDTAIDSAAVYGRNQIQAIHSDMAQRALLADIDTEYEPTA